MQNALALSAAVDSLGAPKAGPRHGAAAAISAAPTPKRNRIRLADASPRAGRI
jgi:hypothetical protein